MNESRENHSWSPSGDGETSINPDVGQWRSQAESQSLGLDATVSSRPGDSSIGQDSQSTAEPLSLRQTEDDSLRCVVADVEAFTGDWINRIRRLVHRSAQLIERETLLREAIERLDEQKAEWNRRTASKEEALRGQSKRLTEAWLEVESERRKASQHAQVASATGAGVVAAVGTNAACPVAGNGSQSIGAATQVPIGPNQPVVPSNPAGPSPVAVPVQSVPTLGSSPSQYPTGSPQPVVASNPVVTGGAVGNAQMPAAPPTVGPVPKVPPPRTVPPGNNATASFLSSPQVPAMRGQRGGQATSKTPSREEALGCDAAAAAAETQRRVEEFRRMQRALQGNKDKPT